MEKTMKLLPPTMPNFVSIERPAQPRQNGIQELLKICITEFSQQEAVEYGELMKQTFIEHWRNKTLKTQP